MKRSRDFELLDRMFDKCRIMLLAQSRVHEKLPVSDHCKEITVVQSLESRVNLLHDKVKKLSIENHLAENHVRKRLGIKIST